MPNDNDAIEIFDEDGALTREFLLQRGYCCENGCRNCPYGFRKQPDNLKKSGCNRPGKWIPKPPTTP